MKRLACLSVVLLLGLVADQEAIAQVDTDSRAWSMVDTNTATVGAPAKTDANGALLKRPVPDIDGRPEPGTTFGEGLLWVPRILFSPLYLVSEFVIRRPVGWFLTLAEREALPQAIVGFFTFAERKVGIFPVFFADFNFRPSVGAYAFANDVFFQGNNYRLFVAFGGSDWVRVGFTNRIAFNDRMDLSLGFRFLTRPDFIFNGLGPLSSDDNRSRYGQTQTRGQIEFQARPWRNSRLTLRTQIAENSFDIVDTAFSDADPSLSAAIAAGFFPAPDGLEGYLAVKNRVEVYIDSRMNRPAPGTGIRIGAFLEHAYDLEANDREWVSSGGSVTGFVDVWNQRVLGLGLYLENTISVGDDPDNVPFSELPQAGLQPLLLGGFIPGRLIGNSLGVLTFEYRYPIWIFLDGEVHYSVGNVFDVGFEGFDPELLRQSFGFGFRSVGDRDNSFNILVAFGTRTFRDGANIEQFRLLFGSTLDF